MFIKGRKGKILLLAGMTGVIIVVQARQPALAQAEALEKSQPATYTEAQKPARATLNAIIDNSYIGDERSFLSVSDIKSGRYFRDEIELKDGGLYCVNIYMRNDCPDIAETIQGLTLKTSFPESISEDSNEAFTATIGAENGLVDDTELTNLVVIKTSEDLQLKFVANSIQLITTGESNQTYITGEQLFQEGGILIGNNALDGVLTGGKDGAIELIYYVEAVALPTSVTISTPQNPVQSEIKSEEELNGSQPPTQTEDENDKISWWRKLANSWMELWRELIGS